MVSQLPYFNQIWLNNQRVITSGDRLTVDTDNTMMVRDSGNLVSVNNERNMITGVPTGVNSYYINFIPNFTQVPKVFLTIETTFDSNYYAAVRERTLTGCMVVFSDTIQETGVYLNLLAKT